MQREGLPDEWPDPVRGQLGQGLAGQLPVFARAELDLRDDGAAAPAGGR
jgi:hypothetical protein